MFHYTTSSILHCCAQHKHFKARLRCTYICSASILALPCWEYKSNYIYLKSGFDLALKGVAVSFALISGLKVALNPYRG